MAKLTISVEVEKETYEVGKLLGDIVQGLAAKKPVAQIAAEELTALGAAIDGIQQLPAELKEDQGAFIKALMNPLADAVSSLVKPQAPAQPQA